MCGIIGYTGKKSAVPILLDGLRALEYRGYDSAGVAVFDNGAIKTVKAKGRIDAVDAILKADHAELVSHCGIGHTRWATHGEPSDRNSHPHGADSLMIVHNGIIENYMVLKERLIGEGYTFLSETDTESAAKLIDSYYKKMKDPMKAIASAVSELVGSFAIGVIFNDIPGKIYAVRRDNPLIVAVSDEGNFIASDIPAILKHTKKYYQLGEGDIALIEEDKVSFYGADGKEKAYEMLEVKWSFDAAEKGGFDHFMLKEIHEEPKSIHKTIGTRLEEGLPVFGIPTLDGEKINKIKKIHMVACGSAMHAAMVGKNMIEKMARIPVAVEIASEFRYNDPIIDKDDLVLLITQSGETADTLAALRLAKQLGVYTLSIVNVVGSSIARESDGVFYTWAGPEIAVATTKGYTVQMATLFLFAFRFAQAKGFISDDITKELSTYLSDSVPASVQAAIEMADQTKKIAEYCKNYEHVFYIGRGIDYALSVEASLKLKEISYIHAEAYAAGELKHGTISLVTEGVPVFAIATNRAMYEKMISNIREVKSRGAHVILVCASDFPAAPDLYDEIMIIPDVPETFAPFPAITLLQMVAYYTAVALECDVDKPRNLAKSVTVE